MRLCFIAPADSVHSRRWIRFFADRGHEVHWISLTERTVDHIEGVRFVRAGRTGYRILDLVYQTLRVRRLVRAIDPDLVHAHSAGSHGLTAVLAGCRPCIVTAWGSEVLMVGQSLLGAPLVKLALGRADLVTCDAYHMRDAMTALGVDADKIQLVYFGVETDMFEPSQSSPLLRKELGISDHAPMVISLRGFKPVYDIESLIRAVPLVLADVPQAQFLVAGSGPQESMLKNLVKELGVSDSVLFPGQIAQEELPRYLASSDVYVSTSLSDAGISASTAEAMACGTAVVVTDSGENRVWIDNGKNGFVVPTRDPQALAKEVTSLLKDSAMRARLGTMARETICERNDHHREMLRMQDMYRELIEDGRCRQRSGTG